MSEFLIMILTIWIQILKVKNGHLQKKKKNMSHSTGACQVNSKNMHKVTKITFSIEVWRFKDAILKSYQKSNSHKKPNHKQFSFNAWLMI